MLKGNTKIQLFDAVSGDEVQNIEKHNMITNAVNKLVSPPLDYLMNNNISYYNCLNDCMPLSEKGLAGILLWEDTIEENADIVMPDFDNKIIGHAGSTYSDADSYRGNFNTNESGDITNGKRFVWDFGTDKANGTISAVSLTSLAGGNCSIGGVTDNLDCFSYFSTILSTSTGFFTAEIEPNLFVSYKLNGSTLTLNYLQLEKSTELHYLHEQTKQILTKTITVNLPFSPNSEKIFTDENELMHFVQYTSSTRTLQYCTVNVTTGAIMDNQSVIIGSLPETFKTTWEPTAVYGGYIYGGGELNSSDSYRFSCVIHALDGSFIKADTDIKFSSLSLNFDTSGAVNGALLLRNDILIKGLNFIKGKWFLDSSHYNLKTLYTCRNIYPYVLATRYETSSNSIYLTKFNPYIGSINNLTTPVVKTNAQTMKITYEVTEV